MSRSFRANIRTNMRFYARNRLLLIVSLLFLVIMLLTMIPSVMFTSSNERFQLITQVYKAISSFMMMLVSLIALISVWYHRSNKCVTLVFTKPCSPEAWLTSHYVSAFILFFAGTGVAVLLYLALSLVWGIPIQTAIFASVFYNFVQALLFFSYLMLLSAWMHPLVAVFFVILFSEGTFYWLALLCRAGVEGMEGGIRYLLIPLRHLFEGFYYFLPTMSPFGEQLSTLDSGLRMSAGDWKYLLGAALYAIVFLGFSFFLTTFGLRHRRLG